MYEGYMDDYTLPSLTQSKNLWCMTLLNILTPCLSQGFKSICDEAQKVCRDSRDNDKYLLTFQTFLSRIPKWNQNIIDNEVSRIVEKSKCSYIEELISCVHIVHLKALTCIRVGKRQKQIDIDVPNLSQFIHKTYIRTARKLYNNVYLYEDDIPPLEVQRNSNEIENIIKASILETINESIPVESILRAYLEKGEEEEDILDNEDTMPTDKMPTDKMPTDKMPTDKMPTDKVDNMFVPRDLSIQDEYNKSKMVGNIDESFDCEETNKPQLVISNMSAAQTPDGKVYGVATEQRDGAELQTERAQNYVSDDDFDDGVITIGDILTIDGIEEIKDIGECPPDLGDIEVMR